jgi:quinol-cytochrome oxidoreductase complex cytochrome b subunit
LKKFEIPLAFVIWTFPVFIFLLPMLNNNIFHSRHATPSFIGVIIITGMGVRSVCANREKAQNFLIMLVIIIQFLSMPVPYYLVGKCYPLRRNFRSSERIIVEAVPLGNIFVNPYCLRE